MCPPPSSTDAYLAGLPGSGVIPQPRGHERVFMVLLDDSPEMPVALHYACLRARSTGGRMALLAVLPQAEFSHWMSVDELVREEAINDIQSRLHRWAGEAQLWSGKMPIIYLREGDVVEELTDTLKTGEISLLVLAARSTGDGPGPVVSHMLDAGLASLGIPLTIVPDSLSDDELAELT